MKRSFALAAAIAAFASVNAFAEEITPDYVDALARRTIEELDLTGLSVTVVTSDKVLFTGSYGLRDVNGSAKVDENTLFPFGSIGKAFTTTALAMLVDEGKLSWDDPVKKFIPEFEMSDPYITKEFSVRDLLTHRSGLPLGAGDLLFVPDADPDMAGLLAAIRNIPPSTSFRSEFAYDNLMYIIAGEVVSRIEGRPWADVIRKRIFKPLGMDACKALPSEGAAAKNTVTQHSRAPGAEKTAPVDPRYILSDDSAPAGGISCSIKDLAKWAQFWLNDAATPSGKTLISEEQRRELWTGVTPMSSAGPLAKLAETKFSLYALGWKINDYHGELMVSHSGGVLGAVANFALLPDHDIAVFATANDFVPGLHSLPLQILSDKVAPDSGVDWIADAGASYKAYRDSAVKDAAQHEDMPAQEPADLARALADYAGAYEDAWYGPATVSVKDGALFLDMGRSEVLDAALTSVGPDKFIARWPDRSLNADAYVTFTVADGAVAGMTMKAVSDTTDFSFDFHDLRFVKK